MSEIKGIVLKQDGVVFEMDNGTNIETTTEGIKVLPQLTQGAPITEENKNRLVIIAERLGREK